MADRGTYRDDRRQAASRIASSIKHAGVRAKRAFFGASPAQKKRLRKTVDKRGIKVSDLDINALDRSKFHAPEKVGESVRLIDIAMGNAPDVAPPTRAERAPGPGRPPGGQAPGAPPPTPPTSERPTRRQPPRPPARPAAPPPGEQRREGDDRDEDGGDGRDEEHGHENGGVGLLPGLAGLLAVLALGLWATSRPLLRVFAPDLAVAGAALRQAEVDPWGNAWCPVTAPGAPAPAKRWSAGPDGRDDGLTRDDIDPGAVDRPPEAVAAAAYAREATLALALVFTWLAMVLGRLRAPRAGLVVEGVRVLLFASLPVALGAGLIVWACQVTPSLGLPAPPDALAPVAEQVAEHVAPLVGPAGLPPGLTAAAAWAALCLLLALATRRALGRRPDDD